MCIYLVWGICKRNYYACPQPPPYSRCYSIW